MQKTDHKPVLIIIAGPNGSGKTTITSAVLKNRLKKEGNESVTKCNQLKLRSSDGKYYLTDVADIFCLLLQKTKGLRNNVTPYYNL